MRLTHFGSHGHKLRLSLFVLVELERQLTASSEKSHQLEDDKSKLVRRELDYIARR